MNIFKVVHVHIGSHGGRCRDGTIGVKVFSRLGQDLMDKEFIVKLLVIIFVLNF